MFLYFVRHGESVANVEKIISNRGFQHPLTSKGVQQVKELADTLEDVEFSHIYTSSLQRATQTAEILGKARNLDYQVDDALREGDCGILEGCRDPIHWQMIKNLESEWFEKGNFEARIEGGESFNDIAGRFVPFIQQVIDRHSQSSEAILLVSHGATLRVGLSQALINVDYQTVSDKPMNNAGYIKVEQTERGLRYLEWCRELPSDQ